METLQHKSYIDIQAFQTKYSEGFNVGDEIYVEEKLDGSNASIQYNPAMDKLECFSRKKILNEMMNLDGFYEYVQKLNKDPFKQYANYRIFGEWNLRHIVKYQPEMIKQFHVFDVYDTVSEQWMSQEFSIKMAQDCGLMYVPIFYHSSFVDWEHIESFIGKTAFGLESGEGIVIKNMSKLNNPNIRQPFVVKLVCSNFKEKMKRPAKEPLDASALAKLKYNQELVESIVTSPRIEKCLYKMIVEENLIPRDWDVSHMGLIAKHLPRRVYNDCVKEANDIILEVENFGKICQKITMNCVKEYLL